MTLVWLPVLEKKKLILIGPLLFLLSPATFTKYLLIVNVNKFITNGLLFVVF